MRINLKIDADADADANAGVENLHNVVKHVRKRTAQFRYFR
jgi:hypothetical protein